MTKDQDYYARGNILKRVLITPLLLFAWFSPHKIIRVFFHRLRGVRIGKNVEIGYFCIIGNVHPKNIIIDDNAVITARVTLLDHDNSYYYSKRGDVKIGIINIKKNVFIGIGTVVMPCITIGEYAIIGANSVVTKDIKPSTINGGVPCREIIVSD